jgi:cytoskeletal protein CcmA (bactofilin family)
MEFKRREGGATRVPEFYDGDGETADEGPNASNGSDRGTADRRGASPDTLAAGAGTNETLVAATSSFDGTFTAEHDLRVRGKVSGEVVCRGRFILERDASAHARIEARDAEIHGQLVGDIVCTGRIELSASAVVTGTIKAGALVVAEGATLSGTVETAGAHEAAQAQGPAREAGATGGRPSSARAVTGPGRREVPSFALVPSDEPVPADPR